MPRLREHLRETREQQAAVEQCLNRLGSDPSALKEGAMKFAANMQGMMHAMASDEVLKHALASHAFEQFEAGCYCSLTQPERPSPWTRTIGRPEYDSASTDRR